MSATIGCPKCGGAICCATESFPGGMSIIIDRASAAWHVANCYGGPPPGDREIIAEGDRLLLDWDALRSAA